MRAVLLLCGTLAVILGLIGLFLPLVPTVPFLILAAFCFARSSKRLHRWLMNHPTFGPQIDDWNRSGVIRRRAKWATTASIVVALALSFLLDVNPIIISVQGLTLIVVGIFVWTRPESPR